MNQLIHPQVITPLSWDSNFFGFDVWTINNSALDLNSLINVLNILKSKNARLAYWGAKTPLNQADANRLGARFVDKKTIFSKRLNDDHYQQGHSHWNIENYDSQEQVSRLEELAVHCGQFSRFATDPTIPREKFKELYRLWIRRSLQKELAECVLVAKINNDIAGMITVGEKENQGFIGLLAAMPTYSGQKLGESLIWAANRWFISKKLSKACVVTQGKNAIACHLYKKCGYQVERVEHYYHFWL